MSFKNLVTFGKAAHTQYVVHSRFCYILIKHCENPLLKKNKKQLNLLTVQRKHYTEHQYCIKCKIGFKHLHSITHSLQKVMISFGTKYLKGMNIQGMYAQSS